jgi:hypothetical protein
LVALRVEVVLGHEVGRRSLVLGRIGRSARHGFSSLQLVVDVGAELEELDARKSLELITGLVGGSIGPAVARFLGEEAPERDVVFAEDSFVVVVALASAALASCVEIRGDAGPAYGGRR